MSEKVFTHAFSGGEVTPELFSRFDLQHVTQSLALCRNFEVLPHGPVRNRTGTEFVAEVKDSTQFTRLIPFSFNAVQTFAIQLGAGWIRFHTQGQTLLTSAGVPVWAPGPWYVGAVVAYAGLTYQCTGPILTGKQNQPPPVNTSNWTPINITYEISSPYAAADLAAIHYTQSADVMTLVHPNYPPMELRRLGAANWTLTAISFAPTAVAPTSVVAVPTGTGSVSYQYTATTVTNLNNLEESLAATASVAITNDLTVSGRTNSITCTAPANAVRVNYFRLAQGLYGYIGQAAPGAAFIDNNITPDVSHTPPLVDSTLAGGVGYYPAAVGYDEQRRFFAGWTQGPQNVIATRSGTESNMNYHIPTVADDRVAFRVAAREGSPIEHIVPVNFLMLLTPTNVFRVGSTDGGALSGSNIDIKPQSYLGANNVQPVTVGTSVLYARAFGGHMTEMVFNTSNLGSYYATNDITLLAPHLFDTFNIVDMAYMRAPYSMLWAVNDQGTLLSMTYVPEQQISAWAHHDTDGKYESCCVISEQGEDMLYVIVKRTINGVTKRYVERKRSRVMATQADAFFVDCGVTYVGTEPVSSLSGITWLEGKTVNILGDGAVMPPQVVTGGVINLQSPATKVQIGLPITADFQTLPLQVALPDSGQGHKKNLNSVYLRVKDTAGLSAGASFDDLVPFPLRSTEPYGSPPNWMQGVVQLVPDNAWTEDGQVCIRQTDPLPATLISLTLEVSIGD